MQGEQRDGSDCEMGGALALMVTVRVLLTFHIPESRTLNTLQCIGTTVQKGKWSSPKASDAPAEKCRPNLNILERTSVGFVCLPFLLYF